MYKSYKIRLYPTKEQEILMWKHIGACRFIWNYMLDLQEKRYEEGEKHLSRFDMMNLLPILKRQEGYLWLQDICARSLQVICTNLSFAYNRYYKKISDLPKYKSRKRNKMIFPVFIKSKKFEKGYAHIEKIGKIKYKTKMNLSFNNKIIHQAKENAEIGEFKPITLSRDGFVIDGYSRLVAAKELGIDKVPVVRNWRRTVARKSTQ